MIAQAALLLLGRWDEGGDGAAHGLGARDALGLGVGVEGGNLLGRQVNDGAHGDNAVAQLSITLRQQHRLKLPDAIVWASARHVGALLVTRNTKDFPKGEPSVRFPYKVWRS